VLAGKLVDQAGRAIEHRFERVRPSRHLAELVPNGAESGNGLPELVPRRRIPRRLADRDAAAARAHRAKLEPAKVQDAECQLMAATDFAEHVRGGDRNIL
jgi:hypothetical protein